MTDEHIRQDAEREAARKKLPYWTSVDEIVFPRHISLEQCSSQQTAEYKASIIDAPKGSSFIDLTGGFGVDCYYIGKQFDKATYVEQNAELCDVAKHNYGVLNYNCEVVCADAVEYLSHVEHVHLIYIDPARRDSNGRRTYDIKDCTPDVSSINELLLAKADKVLVKLSPMFDWHKAVADLKGVTEVHIVSVGNECKELLILMENTVKPIKIFCVNDESKVSIPLAQTPVLPLAKAEIEDYTYLYEPSASIMKAGCFGEIAQNYDLEAVSSNSHLYVSDHEVKDFPGRSFEIVCVTSLNKKEVKEKLRGITQANIATRNFPMNVDSLKKRLKIADGGNIYIFATTTKENKHIMFVCKKIFH
ncbi:MAG: SAM-dependent methyltransferase [Prevotellaceae bacterium]|nr:SAM-dependent methyltransferase [Prevotellaceae bacterium]